MKAAILERYNKNGADLLIRDIQTPEPGANEILVKICTAGVNPLDNMIIRGDVKLIIPYRFPLVMGNEFVGTVEKTGNAVTRFSPGDRVYGRMPIKKIGAFAQYTAVDQSAAALVPDYLSDEEAACVPLTALTAWQAFALMKPLPGQTIFISGGTGSLGAMAIPIAKRLGLKIITNGSADNEKRVLDLGADRFIDYKKEDYVTILHSVDFVLDTLGEREIPKEFSILREGGILVSLRGLPNGSFAARAGMPLWKRWLFQFAGRKLDRLAAVKKQAYHFLFVHEDGEGLDQIAEKMASHQLKASIDQIYTLDDVNLALKKVASGHSKGKTILRIN